jgi:hypothetical protein
VAEPPATRDVVEEQAPPAPEPEPETEPEPEQAPEDVSEDNGQSPVDDTAGPEERAAEHDPDPIEEPVSTAAPERQPTVQPEVASILQEEAARETRIRDAEGNLESQPDLGVETLGQPEAEVSRIAVASEQVENLSSPARSDLLPDIDAINSTFRSGDAAAGAAAGAAVAATRKRGGGFLRGFMLIVVLVLIVVLIYMNADAISAQFPQAQPYLDTFVTTIDKWRLMLEDTVRQVLPQ